MRLPAFKSWLIFAAGFVSALLALLLLAQGAYWFYVKPMLANAAGKLAPSLDPPPFFSPQPADFSFRLVGTNGVTVDFSGYQGRVVILNFWATWCPPCRAELPSLGKLAAHYAGTNDVAVVCASEEPLPVIVKNSAVRSSQAPLYSLMSGHTPAAYHSDAIPATYVIDKKGRIVFAHVGAADWAADSVYQFIDSLR